MEENLYNYERDDGNGRNEMIRRVSSLLLLGPERCLQVFFASVRG